MKRIYITFGGAAFDEHTQHLFEPGDYGCLDEVRVYDDRWLMGTHFYADQRWIFEREPKMGFGWCSWKPYILMHALDHFAQPGDVVLYADADCVPIADLSPIFETAERHDILLFEEQGCLNGMWTRRDCWHRMGLDARYDPKSQHACARFVALTKRDSQWQHQFLWEWQRYALNPDCQFHDPSVHLRDEPEFIRHSAEQSVLSLLALEYAIPLHRTPDQNGWPVAHNGTYKTKDIYPQLFDHRGHTGNVNDLSGSRFRNV